MHGTARVSRGVAAAIDQNGLLDGRVFQLVRNVFGFAFNPPFVKDEDKSVQATAYISDKDEDLIPF